MAEEAGTAGAWLGGLRGLLAGLIDEPQTMELVGALAISGSPGEFLYL
jgi:hypothetical protein